MGPGQGGAHYEVTLANKAEMIQRDKPPAALSSQGTREGYMHTVELADQKTSFKPSES